MLPNLLHPLFLNLVCLATAWTLGRPNSPQIRLGSTGPTVVGKSISENVEFFGGIRYAEPPVGDLRLRNAKIMDYSASDSENTILNATDFGKACIQASLPRDKVSEDCLSVNIFRPSGALLGPNASLPILLWIHGGGWTQGSGSSPSYDGTALVERSLVRNSPILLITINYRLGPLGVPRGREVEGQQDVLNLALTDPLVALEWVKQNINAFGGDPSKVTVFGESAGGKTIELLILNGRLQGLARGAILESAGRSPMYSPSVQDSKWTAYVQNIPPCAEASLSLDCLRHNATTDELYDALVPANITGPALGWLPVIDGPGGMVPDYPSQLDIPDEVDIAIMYGDNLDEGTLLVPQSTNSSDDILSGMFNLIAPSSRGDSELRQALSELLQLYPDDPRAGSPFNTGNETFGLDKEFKRYSAIAADVFRNAQRPVLADKLTTSNSTSRAPLYMYLFADPYAAFAMPPEFKQLAGPHRAPGSLGVPHTSEILYVFGNLEISNSTLPQSAKGLSVKMMDYWISFAVNLNPNDDKGAIRPHWPEYLSSECLGDDPVLLQLKGDESETIPDTFREAAITYINEHSVVFNA